MESKKDDSVVAQFGNLISPVAIAASLFFLFLATSSLEGRDTGNDLNSAVLVTLSVLVPACIGRSSRLIPLENYASRIGSLQLLFLWSLLPIISTLTPSITCSLLPFSSWASLRL